MSDHAFSAKFAKPHQGVVHERHRNQDRDQRDDSERHGPFPPLTNIRV